MDQVFLFKSILSFLIGGLWVLLATTLADKFGSKIGGFIGVLPSTVVFGMFFLAWTQNTQFATQATTIVPIIGGINCLFLSCYIYFVRKNLWKAIVLAFLFWFSASYLLVFSHFSNYLVSLLAYMFLLGFSFVFVEKYLKIKSVFGKKVTYSPLLILGCSFIGGFVVALSVYLGKIGGPTLGGIFSMFPAMFTSLMLVTYFTHGSDFSASVMKASMISGISIVIHSVAVRYTYVPLGLTLGTLVSILISFGSGFLIYKFIVSKLK